MNDTVSGGGTGTHTGQMDTGRMDKNASLGTILDHAKKLDDSVAYPPDRRNKIQHDRGYDQPNGSSVGSQSTGGGQQQSGREKRQDSGDSASSSASASR